MLTRAARQSNNAFAGVVSSNNDYSTYSIELFHLNDATTVPKHCVYPNGIIVLAGMCV